MSFFDELKKKPHVANHPIGKHHTAWVKKVRDNAAKRAQMQTEEDYDLNDMFSENEGSGKKVDTGNGELRDVIKASVEIASKYVHQLQFPITPDIRYVSAKNIRHAHDGRRVLEAHINLECSFRTLTGTKKSFDIPVTYVHGEIVPPSTIIVDGSIRVLAQSTVDDMVHRYSSYELEPIRDMFEPFMTRDERIRAIEQRNSQGYQPRRNNPNQFLTKKSLDWQKVPREGDPDFDEEAAEAYMENARKERERYMEEGGPEKYEQYMKEKYPEGLPWEKEAKNFSVPPMYKEVTEAMEEAEKNQEDTFPRMYHHLLRNYILQFVSTAEKDRWMIHLINDGYCINPNGPNRGRPGRQAKKRPFDKDAQLTNYGPEDYAVDWFSDWAESLEGSRVSMLDELADPNNTFLIKELIESRVEEAPEIEDWDYVVKSCVNIIGRLLDSDWSKEADIYSDEGMTIMNSVNGLRRYIESEGLDEFIGEIDSIENKVEAAQTEHEYNAVVSDLDYLMTQVREAKPPKVGQQEERYIIDLPEMKGKVFDSYENAYQELTDYYWTEAEETAYKYPDIISDVGPGEIIEQLADFIKRAQQVPSDTEEPQDEMVDEFEDMSDNPVTMYPGTVTPVEIGDGVKHNNGGPGKATIVEIMEDGRIIIKSKGMEYRVNFDEIEPLPGTFRKMYLEGKRAQWGWESMPPRKFELGDRVIITDLGAEGVVSFYGDYDDYLEQYRVKVQLDDGTRKYWNEDSLQKIGSKKSQWSDPDMDWDEGGKRDSEIMSRIDKAILPVIDEALDNFMGKKYLLDEWFDTDAGDYYLHDFNRYCASWIQSIVEAVYDAEVGGTGDISSLDYTDIPKQMAEIVFKVAPEGVSENNIYDELKEIEDSVINIAFEAAAGV